MLKGEVYSKYFDVLNRYARREVTLRNQETKPHLASVLHKTQERRSMLTGSIAPPQRQFLGIEDRDDVYCQIVRLFWVGFRKGEWRGKQAGRFFFSCAIILGWILMGKMTCTSLQACHKIELI